MQTPTPEELAGYLRCLVNDLCLLASSIESMADAKSNTLAEVFKTSALVKLRTVYDFFHRPTAQDSIKLRMFEGFSPTIPPQRNKEWDPSLTHQSINTYVSHLDVERVTKAVPQPKFGRGERAVLRTGIDLMRDAKLFVKSVLSHPDFPGLNKSGREWWLEFVNTLQRLETEQFMSKW